ncbi:hypothetical protein V5O48_017017 [Marasmius crinis-equi]|uniref:Uncharacterized protein n=1 Tax=Marasmius crinis-equi TaxID=585013 RepID=A0ABR3EQ44_9AGAR
MLIPSPPFRFGTVPPGIVPATPMGMGFHFNGDTVSPEQAERVRQRYAQFQADMLQFGIVGGPWNIPGGSGAYNQAQPQLALTADSPLANTGSIPSQRHLSTTSTAVPDAINEVTASLAAATVTGNAGEGEGANSGHGGGEVMTGSGDGANGPGDVVMGGDARDESSDVTVVIHKPKGEPGNKKTGYSLLVAMRWKTKHEHNAFMSPVRDASRRVGIKDNLTYKQLEPEMISNVCKLVSKDWPYVNKKRFPGLWPIKEAMKQQITNRRGYRVRRARQG